MSRAVWQQSFPVLFFNFLIKITININVSFKAPDARTHLEKQTAYFEIMGVFFFVDTYLVNI